MHESQSAPTERQRICGYEVIDSVEVGNKVFALGYCAWAAKKFGTWEAPKDNPEAFDWPYLTNNETEARWTFCRSVNNERRRVAEQGRDKGARNRDEAR